LALALVGEAICVKVVRGAVALHRHRTFCVIERTESECGLSR
jgi:hypothetical protein